MNMSFIPAAKYHLFWSVDPDHLDHDKHQEYIIHQVLQFGDLEDYFWLKTIYPEEEIKQIFLSHPRKAYTTQTFNFIKNYLLKINQLINPDLYVTSIS